MTSAAEFHLGSIDPEIADIIAEALTTDLDATTQRALLGRVDAPTKKHPLYPTLPHER